MLAAPSTVHVPMAVPAAGSYLAGVLKDLCWQRFAFAGAVATVMATQLLLQPDLLDFWDPADIASALGRYALELGFIACALLLTFTFVDRLPVTLRLARLAIFAAAFSSISFVAVVVIGAIEFYPQFTGMPIESAIAESLRWSLLAGFLGTVYTVHRGAVECARLAGDEEETREALRREQLGMQLQLLQAQIEPHFLFNTLANMRRLYRTQPEAGAQMIDSLLRYLRAALPQIRQTASSLGDELELIRAYLELVRIRMGARLRYSIRAEAALRRLAFPPLLLITLVENAVKHGIEPSLPGGSIEIEALLSDGLLQITVADDGVGLGAAETGGTGVGLANIRRQLALRFGLAAALTMAERLPHGVTCTLSVPLVAAGAALPGGTVRVAAA